MFKTKKVESISSKQQLVAHVGTLANWSPYNQVEEGIGLIRIYLTLRIFNRRSDCTVPSGFYLVILVPSSNSSTLDTQPLEPPCVAPHLQDLKWIAHEGLYG